MKLILKLCATVSLAFAIVLFGAPEKAALAGEYPDKTVRAIVPFGAGGGTDRWVRVMSSVGFDIFDKGMRVQNRGGASGTVGSFDSGCPGRPCSPYSQFRTQRPLGFCQTMHRP